MIQLRPTHYTHLSYILIFIVIALFLSACSSSTTGEYTDVQPENTDNIAHEPGEMSREIPFVYTTKRQLTITFNGMGDADMMYRILDQLGELGIKATFFLPGMRVAEEPNIAKEIVARGHDVQNNTLNRNDLTKLSYDEIYQEINLANEVIQEKTGVTPKYIRTKSGEYNDDVRLAATEAGLDAVIYYSANPQDWDMKSAEAIADYVSKYITRGGIITLNADINPAVVDALPLIYDQVKDTGYELVTLSQLVEEGSERKPLEEIEGYDAAQINPNYDAAEPEVIELLDQNKKQIALTFDDWGRDKRITRILDILAEQNVKATFFLRADGVEANPNLAAAIEAEGHDIANHTYSHPVLTGMAQDKIQQEIVKAHQVLTYALQKQPLMIFRPPTGEIDEPSAQAIAATGYKKIVLYDVTTLDWDVNHHADHIINGSLEQTKNGSIILLHLQDELYTADALPTIITKLKSKGYEFVLLSDVLGLN
ncbi:polysaccharide deacetylase family protein [Radiobacillus sp. PE A8.2]|uniref:polysaccharide deacetylase family protein n=1 Tax=Radiobacillus sp. PE A8.2 TaxID=3380349 RepID=UPI00388DF769